MTNNSNVTIFDCRINLSTENVFRFMQVEKFPEIDLNKRGELLFETAKKSEYERLNLKLS